MSMSDLYKDYNDDTLSGFKHKKKSKSKKNSQNGKGSFPDYGWSNAPTKCPKCKSKLLVKAGMFTDLYFCGQCGYQTR